MPRRFHESRLEREAYEAERAYDDWLSLRAEEEAAVKAEAEQVEGYDEADDAFDPDDPYDRLESEGGRL